MLQTLILSGTAALGIEESEVGCSKDGQSVSDSGYLKATTESEVSYRQHPNNGENGKRVYVEGNGYSFALPRVQCPPASDLDSFMS
jgi:hypothetical protein